MHCVVLCGARQVVALRKFLSLRYMLPPHPQAIRSIAGGVGELAPPHQKVVFCNICVGMAAVCIGLAIARGEMTALEKRILPDFLAHPSGFHLLGVCGTGMGALAVLLRESGYVVSGSDTVFYPPMSDILVRLGIETFEGWGAEQLDGLDPGKVVVVVGNVCRRTNEACQAAMARGFSTLSLPETLYHFFLKPSAHRLVVTGTHGKTTTSSLLASMLVSAGWDPSFFIGGELLAYQCGAHRGGGDAFIVEGDEYDSAWFDKVPKFWHYAPTVLGINNIEFDHADIYQNLDEILFVFSKLVSDMGGDGCICYNADDANVRRVVEGARCRKVSFSVEGEGDFVARGVRFDGGGVAFELVGGGHSLSIRSALTGMHNVYNLLLSSVMALVCGVEASAVDLGVSGYRGVKKRQEKIGESREVVIYDDFAHHPTAVRETVRAIRLRHPSSRLWGVFEMKSNTSRRAIFQHDYPEALRGCDDVILSAPWKKDDLPAEALIDIPRIVEDLRAFGVDARLIEEVDDIVCYLADHVQRGDVVLGMSGSSFGNLHRKLLAALNERASL